MSYPTPPRCEQCGGRSTRLLRAELHRLIVTCTLHEVLDRFAGMVDEQAVLLDNEPMKADWSALCVLLEKATEQALVIAELKHRKGEKVWE